MAASAVGKTSDRSLVTVEVVESDSSLLHEARRGLFSAGVRRGFVTAEEIERAVPLKSTSSAERWLLYYSLNAIGVEIRLGSRALRSDPGGWLSQHPRTPRRSSGR